MLMLCTEGSLRLMKKKQTYELDICTHNCLLNASCTACLGCGRTLEEISNWFLMDDDEKLKVITRIRLANIDGSSPKPGQK